MTSNDVRVWLWCAKWSWVWFWVYRWLAFERVLHQLDQDKEKRLAWSDNSGQPGENTDRGC